ncbi:MAG: choice-of-anchor J domain-containing protein [Candidatus Cloacimonadia bacterium]
MRTHLMKAVLLILLINISIFLFAADLTTYSEAKTSDVEVTHDLRASYIVERLDAQINSSNNVDLSWNLPIGVEPWSEDFETGRLAEGWIVEGINETETGPQGVPGTWIIASGYGFGNYSVVLPWDYEHQNEWLITPEFICPSGTLTFWTKLDVMSASARKETQAVHISLDGGESWQLIHHLTAILNLPYDWDRPVEIPLDNFVGKRVMLAWQGAEGMSQGLYTNWFIDNISVGGAPVRVEDLRIASNGNNAPTALDVSRAKPLVDREATSHAPLNDHPYVSTFKPTVTRGVEGYAIYRFPADKLNDPAAWYELTIITDPEQISYEDTDWPYLEDNRYQYAIRVMHDGGELSQPTISRSILHAPVAEVIINITTNSGDSAAGTYVQFNDLYDSYNSLVTYAGTDGVARAKGVRYSSYQIRILNPDFEDFIIPGIDVKDDPFEFDVELTELLKPVVDLNYNLIGGNSVELNWLEPGTLITRPQWFGWDNGNQADAIRTDQPTQFTVAIRFTEDDLKSLQVVGLHIDKVKFFPHEQNCAYTINIWQNGSSNPLNPGTLIHSQYVSSFVNKQWNTVELTTPIPIDGNGELWIGYDVNTMGGFPAGTDSGPSVNGKGDVIFMNGQWTTLLALAPTLNFNWCIQAYAGLEDEEVLLSNDATRALKGYKVMRNTTVLTEDHSSTTYIDSNVPNGNWAYSVYAMYTTGQSERVSTEYITILNADDNNLVTPNITKLIGNYPNPFNPNTQISFSLDKEGFASIEIFNMKGQKVKTLLQGVTTGGYHTVNWDGKDDLNNEVGSGVFFYKLTTDSYTETKKMIMMK